MSRLYDRVRRSGGRIATDSHLSEGWWRNRGWAPGDHDAIDDAVVVQVGAAANYFYEHKPGLHRDAKLSPPFPIAFYEAKRPSWVDDEYGFAEWGFCAIARDLADEEQKAEYESWALREEGIASDPGYGCRWIVEYNLFANEPRAGGLGGPIGTWHTYLDEDGACRRDITCSPMTPGLDTEDEAVNHARFKEYYGLGASLLAPILFSVALMHCKNVSLDANEPSARLSRKHKRKYGYPLTRYYTLAVDPSLTAKPPLKSELGSQVARALHIARGHFATYSPEKPLFGKYSGTFWRPQHVRGSKAQGEIIKDYKVKSPRG